MAVSATMVSLFRCRKFIKPSHSLMTSSRWTLARLKHIMVDSTGDDDGKNIFRTYPLRSQFTQDLESKKVNIPHCSNKSNTGDSVFEILNCLRKVPREALSFFSQVKARYGDDVKPYAKVIAILSDSNLDEGTLNSALVGLIRSEEEGYAPVFNLLDLMIAVEVEIAASTETQTRFNAFTRAINSLFRAYVSLAMFNEIEFVFVCSTLVVDSFLDIKTFNFLLSRLIEHGEEDRLLCFYELFKKLSVTPNDETYAIVLRTHYRMGKSDEVAKVFEEMRGNDFEETTSSDDEEMTSDGSNEDEDEMTSSGDEEMTSDGSSEDDFAFSTCIEELCLQGEFELGYKMYADLKAQGIAFSFTASAYKRLIDSLIKAGRINDVNSVLAAMRIDRFIPDAATYHAIIQNNCNIGNFEKALNLHDDMLSVGIETDGVITRSILLSLFSMDKFEKTVAHFKNIKALGVLLDEFCYNVVMDSLCQLGKVEEALKLLNEMKGVALGPYPDARHYTSLLKGCCRIQNLPAALSIFEEMKEKGVFCQT